MKIPMIFVNRDTVELYLGFHSAFRHLYIGFKELFICIVFAIPCIFLTILEIISRIFKKENK